MNSNSFFLVLTLTLICNQISGQIITGRITDCNSKYNNQVYSAQVLVKGTNKVVSVNSDGTYEIEVDSLCKTLVFQCYPMETKEVAINGRTEVNVCLDDELWQLDELKITAHYTRRKTGFKVVADTIKIEKGIFRTKKDKIIYSTEIIVLQESEVNKVEKNWDEILTKNWLPERFCTIEWADYVIDNFHYPIDLINNGIIGRIYIGFTIDLDGNLKNVEILRGSHDNLDSLALEVIEHSPKLCNLESDPEYIYRKNYYFRCVLPVLFEIKTTHNTGI